MAEIDEAPFIKDSYRIGIKKGNLIRPVKISLNNSHQVSQILKITRKLRTKEGFKSIYICPDWPFEERAAYIKLADELKQKRALEPNKIHFTKNSNE